MSRWIDADKVLKIVNDMTECEDDYERITEWIHNMPSIDIVKCGDCKYDHQCNHSVQRITSKPDYMSIIYVPIGWCERGERRE